MIDTNSLPAVVAALQDSNVVESNLLAVIQHAGQVKQSFAPYLPALAVAAAWAGREIRNVNLYLENVAGKIIAHGGIWQIVKKLWNNPGVPPVATNQNQKESGK